MTNKSISNIQVSNLIVMLISNKGRKAKCVRLFRRACDLKSAKALGLSLPQMLLRRANEVI
jgi:hypothetical protein